MNGPKELRRGLSHSGGKIAFYALFKVEPTEIPAGWQREPVTYYFSDGTPAVAYCKFFPWNARLQGEYELGNQRIVLI